MYYYDKAKNKINIESLGLFNVFIIVNGFGRLTTFMFVVWDFISKIDNRLAH